MISYPITKIDLFMIQGKTFTQGFTLKSANGVGVDISAWILRGQMRRRYSDETISATFVCTKDPLVLGRFTISLTAGITAGLGVSGTTGIKKVATPYAYDIKATRGDKTVIQLFEGTVSVWPEVTR